MDKEYEWVEISKAASITFKEYTFSEPTTKFYSRTKRNTMIQVKNPENGLYYTLNLDVRMDYDRVYRWSKNLTKSNIHLCR